MIMNCTDSGGGEADESAVVGDSTTYHAWREVERFLHDHELHGLGAWRRSERAVVVEHLAFPRQQ